MEKTAQIGGIQRFSISDGPGIRTTVFFKGCPLKCKWCHNPELVSFDQDLIYTESRCIRCGTCIGACHAGALSARDGCIHVNRDICDMCLDCASACPAKALRAVSGDKTVAEIMDTVVRDRTYYEESGGGVTLSGGEVLSQADFAYELALACKEEGISVVLDTSGYGRAEDLLRLAVIADTILFDVKAGTDEHHRDLIGVSLGSIRANLDLLAADETLRSKVIIRMPLVKGVNDTDEDIRGTCEYLRGKGFREADLLPYHDLGVSKLRGLGREVVRFEAPSDERLRQIAAELEEAGIHAARSKGEPV